MSFKNARCTNCNHEWHIRVEHKPRKCPKCWVYNWWQPRNHPVISHEEIKLLQEMSNKIKPEETNVDPLIDNSEIKKSRLDIGEEF